MANPAVVADVENRWRTLTTSEHAVAGFVLDDAWETLRLRSPGLEARWVAGQVAAATIVAVEVAMVLRVLRSPDPDGVLASETIGSYSYQRSRAAGDGAGLYVTDAELELLTPPAGAFTIRAYAVPTWT